MITPLRDQVYVELLDEPEPTAGAISVVRLTKQPSARARVLAVGDEVRDTAPDAECVVSRLQGIIVGDGMLMLPEAAVLAHYVSDAAGEFETENGGAGEAGGLLNV